MISVALCTYNGEDFIREQLDSILSQTMPVDEIVIRDDCSKDSTCRILEEYASRYACIHFRRNETNLGFAKNFESALIDCHGDYIFFSDQDDVWSINKVETIVDYLTESGMYGVYSDGQLIDQNGRSLHETLFSRLLLTPYIDKHILDSYEFEVLCLRGNHVTGATLAITKQAKDIVLPFLTSKHYLHDMWIALKLASIHKLGCINKPLISYRLHVGQECGLDTEKNDIDGGLIDCIETRGRCDNLLLLRHRSISPIYIFRLSLSERTRIYNLYRSLYFKNLSKDSRFKEVYRFIITEFIVFLKTWTGVRVFY